MSNLDTPNKEDEELLSSVDQLLMEVVSPVVRIVVDGGDPTAAAAEGTRRVAEFILARDQQIAFDEKYLLECFEAVARYAQDPTELGGMKPETALMNFKNIGIKSSQQIALAARIDELSHLGFDKRLENPILSCFDEREFGAIPIDERLATLKAQEKE